MISNSPIRIIYPQWHCGYAGGEQDQSALGPFLTSPALPETPGKNQRLKTIESRGDYSTTLGFLGSSITSGYPPERQ